MSIDKIGIIQSGEKIKDEITAIRRKLHRFPEVGTHLPKTAEYVKSKLTEMGYKPREICESGIVAEISGSVGGACIMLRADMDALAVREETELEYKSQNGNMHACGHDMHTAMLLGAAKILKEHQNEIKGTVKFVFQPDEEGFTGAKTMIENGVLENPAPDSAVALHVISGVPSGKLLCGGGTFMASCTLFKITVTGRGCHGAMPETGVDPIVIAAHILLSLEEITSREISALSPVAVTVGKMTAGDTYNVIPQTAEICGTIRTYDEKLPSQIMERIREIAENTARAFRGEATVCEVSSVMTLKNDTELMSEMSGYAEELFGEKPIDMTGRGGMGSEDFAMYTHKLPCAYILLGAGDRSENPLYGTAMHNSRVIFNEAVLPKGAEALAYFALRWLESR